MVKEEALKDLKELLKGKTLESAEKPWNNLDDDSLQEVGKDKIEPLKEAIKEIEALINSRNKLSRQVLSEAEAIKMDINNFISNTGSGRRIDDVAFLRDQLALKQKQVEVSELKERESRIDMLNKILE